MDSQARSDAPRPAPSGLFATGDRRERYDETWDSAAARWLDARDPVRLRTNASDTKWFADDTALAPWAGVKGLLLPTAESIASELSRMVREYSIGLIGRYQGPGVRVIEAGQDTGVEAVAVDSRMTDCAVWLKAARVAGAAQHGRPVRFQAS